MPNLRPWQYIEGPFNKEGSWKKSESCNCKKNTGAGGDNPGHAVAYFHKDHDIHFTYGNDQRRTWWRDYAEYCGSCDHICRTTTYGMDNGNPLGVGEWRAVARHQELKEKFLLALEAERNRPEPLKIYDSMLDRPRVRIWTNGVQYWTQNYGGRVKNFPSIREAADEALANFYLYGGYGGDIFLEQLEVFIKRLTVAMARRLKNNSSESNVWLSGSPENWLH